MCFGLDGDNSIKAGQIAHLDRDPSNNAESNLAFLCLAHHDQYDSRTSQSKGITRGEIVNFQDALREAIERGEIFTDPRYPPTSEEPIQHGLYHLIADGRWRANLSISSAGADFDGCERIQIYGEALFGVERPNGPNIGIINVILRETNPNVYSFFEDDYSFIIHGTASGFIVEEQNPHLRHGLNVTFSGEYRSVRSFSRRLRYWTWFHSHKLLGKLPE